MGVEPDNKVGNHRYYMVEANELSTEFKGNLARILGIEGTFGEQAYDRLFRGMNPELTDGRETKLTLRLDKDRTGAWDWTFNVPKSVSVAEQVAGDTRIGDVRTRAEEKAMRLIESQATVKVRKKSEIEKSKKAHPKAWKYPERKTDNLLYIPFRHTSSRSGDPASHTHYVIYNLSFDKQERVFKAVNLKHVDRKAAGDLYHKELRKGLNELGYKTKTVGKSFEIVGFPAEIKAEFSQRHHAIADRSEEFTARTGRKMSNQAQSVINRPEKPDDKPLAERRADWAARLTDRQRAGLKALVSRAKGSLRRSRLRAGMKRHLDKARSFVLEEVKQHGKGLER